jgi:hypothetical protein
MLRAMLGVTLRAKLGATLCAMLCAMLRAKLGATLRATPCAMLPWKDASIGSILKLRSIFWSLRTS